MFEAVTALETDGDGEAGPVREADKLRHTEGVPLTERVALSGEPVLLPHTVADGVGMALVGEAVAQAGEEAVGEPVLLVAVDGDA